MSSSAGRFGGVLVCCAALALQAGCGRGAPSTETAGTVEAAGEAWFTEIGEAVGVVFRHSGGVAGGYGTPEITGSGGALFDYDGDGDLDLYLVDVAAPSEALRNQLFRQELGGRFVNVTAASGLGDTGYGMGAALGDVDADGDADLLVTNMGPDELYLNRGDGSFEAAGAAAGVGLDVWSTSACFFDYDRDGRLDLYVATYLRFEWDKRCTDRAGNPEFCGPEAFRGVPDLLYRGRGDGTFTLVSEQALPGQPANKALGVVCGDLDDDGLPDVYVANDGEQNQLWMNQGDGTFAEQALIAGAALNLFGRPEASMGVAAGDLDGDLDLDLFMTHLDRETNTFYANLGDGSFEDRTPTTGLGPASMPHTGFGAALFDADLDGDLDLALVNGRVRRGASLSDREERQRTVPRDPSVPKIFDEYVESNLFFLNEGGGSFRNASAEAGWSARAAAVSRGLLLGDLDGDGDADVVVTNCGSLARVFRNDLPRQGAWLAVEAVEGKPPRSLLGASIEVEARGRRLRRDVSSTYGYLAASRARVHFGLADAERVDRLEVRWPDGGRGRFSDLPADRSVRVFRRQRGGAPGGTR